MKKVMWFSQHEPTNDQLKEMIGKKWEITTNIEKGISLGKVIMETEADVFSVGHAILDLCEEEKINLIIGVFSAPMQQAIFNTACDAVSRGGWDGAIPCWSAWNIRRGSKEGFKHQKFIPVGALSREALRWFKH